MAVNQESVNATCEKLVQAGQKPTLAAVRDSLGEGSFSTLAKMVRDWKAGRGDVAGVEVVAVSVPDVVATAGGKLLAEVWALAEKAAGERLAAERAEMEAAKAEMGGELEAAYAEMETLREQLAKAHQETEIETSAVKFLREENKKMEKEMKEMEISLAGARGEAWAFKMAIEKINPQVNQEQPKKPAPGKKAGKAIGKSNQEPIDTLTAPLVL